MKEINLPITTTYSIECQVKDLPSEGVLNQSSRTTIPLGSINIADHEGDGDIARANGGKILYATTSIEKRLEKIISDYIFGLYLSENKRRAFFENELLKASILQLSFKKQLVKKIVQQGKYLKGKERESLEKKLADILKWRNAFAHGTLKCDNHGKWILKYYSNGNKAQNLDDAFWDRVVRTFENCNESLRKIDGALSKELIFSIK